MVRKVQDTAVRTMPILIVMIHMTNVDVTYAITKSTTKIMTLSPCQQAFWKVKKCIPVTTNVPPIPTVITIIITRQGGAKIALHQAKRVRVWARPKPLVSGSSRD
jgi:hypothetical protein